MNNYKNIHVLNGFKPFLRLLKAFNSDILFHYNSNWRLALHSAKYAFYSTMILISSVNLILFGCWYLLETGAMLETIVVSLPLLMGLLQTTTSFIAMLIRNRIIIEAINRMQNVVDQRKYQIIHFYLFNLTRENHILAYYAFFVCSMFSEGCSSLDHCSQFYAYIEEKCAFFVAIVIKLAIVVNIIMFSISSLLPISYAIFGYPPPQLWTLPLQTQ